MIAFQVESNLNRPTHEQWCCVYSVYFFPHEDITWPFLSYVLLSYVIWQHFPLLCVVLFSYDTFMI